MIPVMCIVQKGHVSRDAEAALKAQIGRFTQRVFSAPAEIDWIVVPTGSGFTAAAPSSAVIASLHANRPLTQVERVALLRELGDICVACTGCLTSDVMTSIRTSEEA